MRTEHDEVVFGIWDTIAHGFFFSPYAGKLLSSPVRDAVKQVRDTYEDQWQKGELSRDWRYHVIEN